MRFFKPGLFLIVFIFILFIAQKGAFFMGTSRNQSDYKKITPQQAKEMMEDLSLYLEIIDVRSQGEYKEGHIAGAISLPLEEIDSAEDFLPDKNQEILVYCRSGRRSYSAALSLLAQGYTHVYDFGGIIDWPYDIVK